ncbi:MAG: hypothetical protein VBE63_19355, partial [Lamprobacter sp.]|uniref:hypothetical protein n=1 Tax=Lamprobacter sp. TaxID=3100796 RepID=UPI002B260DFA
MKPLCNLVVPGFPKSGTSSLHEYLDLHPQINMSRHKESHFFAIEKHWNKGWDYHNSLFNISKDYSYYGESSTIYCISEKSIERIQSSLKSPKFIFLLRHPVQRVLSHYRWLCALGLERRP